MLPIRVAATGVYIPQQMITAGALDSRLGLSSGTVLARNGVATRYFADEAETASVMGSSAVEQALSAANLDASSLDAILFSGVMS
jgi:3-oxoacyl-[acyl-carrier-protein] synthase-3